MVKDCWLLSKSCLREHETFCACATSSSLSRRHQSLSSVNIDEIFTMLGSFLYQISAPIA